jgi:exodeoxyribonuclease-3
VTPAARAARSRARTMKIATWNVNGIRARQTEVRDWVARERPDVICLQEIKATPEQIPVELCEMDGYWCYWHGAKGYSGVGLHVSKALAPAPPLFSHPAFDRETRIVTAQIDAVTGGPAGALTVASVYVPNGGKDFAAKMDFLAALDAYADAFRATSGELAICGDLNVARADIDVHARERKPGVIGQRPDERALIEQILGRDLRDVARALAPDDDQLFTWWAPWRNLRQRNIGWRIDYLLASESLAARAVSCTSSRETGTSDHAPVVAEFT